ncbi:MAG TPA: EF-P beta-lysylation protein EpmB [Gammaproteobacteria bacterium]|nr:EF-P beta-lysylation protein EpmB [Gammaproteobacteria bacterium]
MISRTPDAPQPARWQRELAAAITDPAELLARLQLDPALLEPARAAAATFALRVPASYLARMRPGDPHDPLLRQVLPLGAELTSPPGYLADPVGDLPAGRVPGLLQKYRGRALVITTGACAVHCRYCFRRHYPYAQAQLTPGRRAAILAALAGDRQIHEVILSGGDPLSLGDHRLADLVAALGEIPHLRRLRLHTRTPIVLPSRIDGQLSKWLAASRLPMVFVLHANHPQELDSTVASALARLRQAGATLLNQAVLLRGVNDDAETLVRLSERLFEIGVLPYYLHLLDPVRGAAHFDVPRARARALLAEISGRLSGYLVPRLVREIPGAPAKVPVDLQLAD